MTRSTSNIPDILHTNYQYNTNTRASFLWIPINVSILSFVIYDIWENSRVNLPIVILEHVLAIILSLNILYFSCKWFGIHYFPKKYQIPSEKYHLLQNLKSGNYEHNINVILEQNEQLFNENKKIYFENFRVSSSPLFNKTSPTSKSEIVANSLKMEKFPIKVYNLSPTSFYVSSPVSDTTSLFSTSSLNSSNDIFCGNVKISDSSPNLSKTGFNLSKIYGEDNIDQVDSVSKSDVLNLSDSNIYWKKYDNSLCYSNQNIQRPFDVVPNDVYQLSSVTTSEFVKPINEISSLGANPSVCTKFGINQSFLPEWIANLRMWITQTILTRVIKEIKDVNQALSLQGITNVSVGSSGLERLRKTASMSQVYQNVPSLSSLLSFLDVSINQEYVVQRITALTTGSMSNYCWNSGGTYEGKPWNENLPTDAALVMHLVAAYFDSQLYPLPHTAPDGKQFSSAHYVKTPTILVKNQKSLIIYQKTINPPHFQLIIGEETYDISRGRNNLFHVLLFFLHHVKTKESGMFEHVNLGSSGINMLWIINEPSFSYKKY